MRLYTIGMFLALATTTACGGGDNLLELGRPADGPDEFAIVPRLPLEEPENYGDLPAPTPGEANRTDQNPLADSVAALGGRRASATGPIPATDGGIVNYASRFGRDGSIRQTLATEDQAYRDRRGRFTRLRLQRRDLYAKVYAPETLDAKAEARKWRRAGARTPSGQFN